MKKRKIYGRIWLAAAIAAVSVTGCAPAFVKDAADTVRDKIKDAVTDQAEGFLDEIQEKIGKKEKKNSTSSDDSEKDENDSEREKSGSGEDEDDSEKDKNGFEDSDGQADSVHKGTDEAKDPYDTYIKEVLEKQLGEEKDISFTYGYQRRDYDGGYWSAVAETAPLADGMISVSRNDLNQDGQDELLVCLMEGSQETGSGHNCLRVDAYGIAENEVVKIGSIQFPECFEIYNDQEYVVGLKTVGQDVLIYAYDNGSVWSWADGVNPHIRLFQYDGSYLKEQYNVACSGSDGSWWDQWERELRSFGFDISKSLWDDPCLTEESSFDVILYGESRTVVNKDAMFANGVSVESTQGYMLDHAVVQGSLYGKDSQVVCRMNQEGKAPGNLSGEAGNGTVRNYGQEDSIIPDSSSRYLSRADLLGLSKDQLRLARNEIYARHGRKFQSRELQEYFESKSWYRGTIEPNQFSEDNLNAYEKENIKLIKNMEE